MSCITRGPRREPPGHVRLKHRLAATVCCAAMVLTASQALAQSTWNGSVDNGYGTASNWTPSGAPVSPGQSAVFGSSGTTTVNVSGAIAPDSWTFNSSSSNYGIFGGTANFGGAGVIDSASGQGIFISTSISGTGGVAVHDTTGTLTLSGSNTYSGATTIDSSATLKAGSTGAFSASSAYTVNGTLNLNGFSNSIGALSGSGTVALGAQTLTVNSGNFSGVIGDGGAGGNLTITGNTTLTGNNTYIGQTTISGGTLTVGNGGTSGTLGGSSITDNAALVYNRSDSYILGSNIIGSGTLTQAGSGTLILASNNGYAGGTTISAGTLQVGNGSTVGALGSGAVTDNAALVFNRSNTVTLANTITGTGTLQLTGSGTVILTATNNSYSGTTTISSGTLQIGDGGNDGSLGTGNVTNNGALVVNDHITITFANNISGSGTFTDNNSGAVILTGTNTYSGGTIINAGAIQISAGGTTGSITGNVTDNAAIAFNRSDNISFGGNISGTGFVQIGSGIVTLTGNNNYTGVTNVFSGVAISGDNNIGTGDVVLFGGTVIYNASYTSAINYQLTTSGGSINTNGNTVTLSGVAKDSTNYGTGGLFKTGAGTLILTGANTYTNITTISAGTLQLGNGGTSGSLSPSQLSANAIITDNSVLAFDHSDNISNFVISGTGSVVQLGGGILTLNNNNTYSGGTTISAGSVQTSNSSGLGTGTITDNANLTFTNTSTITISNAIVTTIPNGSVTQLGFGTTILTGANTYNGGTSIASGATLQVGSGGTSGSLGSGGVADNGKLVFDRSDSFTLINTVSGGGSLTQAGNGTLILNSSNTYGGTTTINSGGTLQVGSGGTNGTLGTGNVINNGTLNFNHTDTITIANTISGSGSLTQSGSGTLTLTGINTYTGATTIASGGTLMLSSSGSIASSSVVNNGTFDITAINTATANIAALSGSGTVALGTKQLIVSSGTGIFGGSFSGTGALELSGGTTTFAGTVRNAVTVDSGATLQIGNGGTTGTVAAPITNNGTLSINRSDNIALSSVITSGFPGGGNLTQAGSGTLGISSFTNFGTITISAGTLQLNNGVGAGNASIVDNGALVFNLSSSNNAVVLGNRISGTGSITVTGGGTVYLEGTSSYSGSTTVASGSFLEIGDATTHGTIGTGAIVNSGTLFFSRSDTVALSNSISGSGTFYQTGTGTLILTGTNTSTGSVVIDSRGVSPLNGTLQIGNGGTSGGLGSGAVTDNGVLVFNRSDTIAIANLISGTGSLTQSGGGTAILTGANIYTGTTTIGAGTLQIGNGGSAGSLGLGNVTNNGTLAFNRSDSVTLSNAVSGTGVLMQSGSGTLILAGANTYTGATTINAGTLQIGNGGTAGSLGTGAVTDNGALAFNRSDTITIANTISGTGTVNQMGSGTTILDGTDTYAGATLVSSGTLEVGDAATPGASVAGPVNVASGGTLSGHGTVKGAVTVASGGSLRPGGTIGTLTVNGNLSLPTGSTLVAEVSPSVGDRVTVGGTAILGGNLQVIADTSTYAAGTDFKLISAASVSGTFANVSGLNASSFSGLTPNIQYSATAVDLILSNPMPPGPSTFLFGSYGTTPNQIAAGNALTAGSPSGALYAAMGALVGSSTASVPAALGQLAGDIRPSLRAAAIEDSRIVRDTLLDHMDHASEGMRVWGAGLGGYGRLAGDGNAANLHHDSAGFLAGLDMPVLPAVTLGVEGGYTSNSARTPGRLSAASGDSGHVGAYAAWSQGNLRFDIGGDYGFGGVTINRTLPQLGLTTTAAQDQETGQVFADLGYRIPLEGGTLEPHATVAHIIATGGSFAETGGIAALSGNEKSDSATYALLGMRADMAEMALDDDMALVPRFDLGWQHALARPTPYQAVNYVNAGTGFTVLGTPLAQDAAALQAGFDLKVDASATLSLSYDGSFSSTVENHAFRGMLSWRF